MKIMTLTTNFGFGPVSKLNTIINAINEEALKVTIDFYGSGISLEYMKKNKNVSTAYSIDTERECLEVARCSQDYDLIINVMNTEILKYLTHKKNKMYFVDSLSMLWNKTFEGARTIDMYFIQDFFSNEKNVKKMKVNHKVVGPIIEVPKKKTIPSKKKNFLVINFSGLYNPYSDENFFYKFAKEISDICIELYQHDYEKLIFCCNHKLAEKLCYENSDKKMIFKFYNHDDFLKICLEARDIFSLSGITFYLESKFLDLNVKYLIPSNYSQYILNKKYRVENLGDAILLEDFSSEYEINEDVDEFQGVNLVEKYILELITNKKELLSNAIKELHLIKPKLDNHYISQSSLGQVCIVDNIKKEFNI